MINYIHESITLTIWKQGTMYHANYSGRHLKATGLSGLFRQISVYDNLWFDS